MKQLPFRPMGAIEPYIRNARWSPPTLDGLKCNVDAAKKEKSNLAVVAFIFTNERGNILTSLGHRCWSSFPLQSKATTLKKSLLVAEALSLGNVCFETDCKRLVDPIFGSSKQWMVDIIIDDITQILRRNLVFNVAWISRLVKKIANEITKLALSLALPCN